MGVNTIVLKNRYSIFSVDMGARIFVMHSIKIYIYLQHSNNKIHTLLTRNSNNSIIYLCNKIFLEVKLMLKITILLLSELCAKYPNAP